ncbi:MAG TPA: DUF2520 domain-containing protein [Chitinophagaceae bacterium]|jgi:predicted short-subunit dehydrogenase-like oxidoreductase (DUF2520 family)|nr:DUF2520 domain-containing protein [Chitinophagaceae bacterium]
MKIVLIGTGNVAVVLSKKIIAAGHSILQVYGRNHVAAALLADNSGASTCSSLNEITQSADLYIIAVTDKALASGELHFRLKNQLVVHTAGSVSKEILKNVSASYGVLYPYQTIRKEVEPLPEIPLLMDANTTTAKEQLTAFGKTISTKIIFANDEQRMQYHLCAVMTNNFSNYLYTLTEDYCNKQALDFGMLLPLIDQTANRLHHLSPRQVQTGPAARKDLATIEQHLNLLNKEPALQHLYKILSDDILKYPW